ncbi:Mtpap [Symbiodinium natans]|uniref:Mtpap protein n=1 Tax=Symbiodinium natans TaxID=878477 RepID=A0A812MIX2_9DINO|nr:Mtpap [Symbiodinium natans]
MQSRVHVAVSSIQSFLRAHATLHMMASNRGVGLLIVITALMFLPLEFTQLAFAVAGACAYTFVQHVQEHGSFWLAKDVAPQKVSHHKSSQKKVRQPATPKPNLPPAPKPSPRQAPTSSLWPPVLSGQCWESDVSELLGQISPNAESEDTVSRLVDAVRETILPIFPDLDACGFVHGNLRSGRAFRVAVPDVEIVLSVSPEKLRQKLQNRIATERKMDTRQLEKAAIRMVAEALVASCGFKFRRSAFRGEEPKLTLLAPASFGPFADAIPLDISVNAETPLYNAALLAECGQLDPRAKQLILLVRRWAKDRGICHAAKGYLSPYHWSLLVIFFLQVRRTSEESHVLPPLQHFRAFCDLTSSSPKLERAARTSAKAGGDHTSQLLTEFMHFYRNFDWRNEMINTIEGERGPPTVFEAPGSFAPPLYLQDPFRPLCNLGDRCSEASFQRIRDELQRASGLCTAQSELKHLFEPWAPSNGANYDDRD